MTKTIAQVIQDYLEMVNASRSENTGRTYKNGLAIFIQVLKDHGFDPESTLITILPENAFPWMISALRNTAPTTERLYLASVVGLYEFIAGEQLMMVNLPRIHLLVKQRARRQGQRLPQFPREDIEKVLDYAYNLSALQTETEEDKLINLRDRAFLITLADTGLRVHEACDLRRGDIDWNEGRALIIGKGDKQAIVRFSNRTMRVLRDYLAARAKLDGGYGKPLPSLPLFARHDKGAGRKVKPMTTTTGRNIVQQRIREVLGPEAAGTITPHSFRHYFVTTVLQASGNLKLAQELARHSSISVTQMYAHLADNELDRGYHEIFNDEDK